MASYTTIPEGSSTQIELKGTHYQNKDDKEALIQKEAVPMKFQGDTKGFACTLVFQEIGTYVVHLYGESDANFYPLGMSNIVVTVEEKITESESETEILETQEEEQNTSWWDGLWKGVQAFGAWLADTGNKIGNKFNASVQKLGEWCPEWLPDWWPFPWPNKE